MPRKTLSTDSIKDKFNTKVEYFQFGGNEDFMEGLTKYLHPTDIKRSMEAECRDNDDGMYYETYIYVVSKPAKEERVKDPATGQWRIKEKGHDGWTLDKFVSHRKIQQAGLKHCHVAAIRMYSGSLYDPWNSALRALKAGSEEGLKKWATCICILVEAILKLSFVAPRMEVLRGLDESKRMLPESFLKETDGFSGGVELAFMSTTRDEDIAMDFSGGLNKRGTILSISFTAASRGADIKLVSMWPEEEELLYPPFTYISCQKVESRGIKKYIEVSATVCVNYLKLDCLNLDDCTSTPQHHSYSGRQINVVELTRESQHLTKCQHVLDMCNSESSG